MARAKKSKKTTSVKVNFKGVESRRTPPEGDYILKVLEAEAGTSSSSGGDQIVFTLEIAKGEYKGQKVWFYCPLAENSLWKLHAFLTALGVDVPEDETEVDLEELVDLEVVGVLTHETYQGKKRAKMTDFDSVDNYKGDDSDSDDDDEDEDEKPKKGKKSKSKKDEDEDEDDEAPKKRRGKKSKKDDDDEDEDEDEKPSKKSKSKKSAKDEDDEEDEDDEPKSKKSKGKKKPKKVDRDDVDEMDEDELQELIDAHDLDVDLDDYKKIAKKREAVIDALEEEDLLED